MLKNLKLFQGTAKVLDGFVDTIGAGSTAKLVACQALKTELKDKQTDNFFEKMHDSMNKYTEIFF